MGEGVGASPEDAPCSRWLSAHGWCGEGKDFEEGGTDCGSCKALNGVSWVSVEFPDTVSVMRADGLWSVRLRTNGWAMMNTLVGPFGSLLAGSMMLIWGSIAMVSV